ncbi:MAG: serine hydrolase domain-containing protein [Solirubrobacteraceae bacterium]
MVSAPSALGAAPTAGPADRALDQSLRALVAMPSGPPGVVAVVQRGRSRVLHRAGVATLKTNQPMRGTDHMRLASVSKAFSGAAVLALVARGKLKLSDTIGKRLPWLPKAWWSVNLRQILDHTSGLPDYTTNPVWQQALSDAPHATPPPPWLLAPVQQDPLVFTPGSKFVYSNTDNIVAALMVEAVTGRTYDRDIAALVTRPLGITRTSVPAGFRLPRPFIHGYDLPPSREDLSEVVSAAWVWASGGLVSTPFDLNSFIRGYVGRRLFGRAVQAQQLRFVAGHSEPIGPGANSAAVGIFRYRTRCGTVYGHTGNFFGFTQFTAATLDGRRSVTVSINEQLNQTYTGQSLVVFNALRAAEEDAVCAALAR